MRMLIFRVVVTGLLALGAVPTAAKQECAEVGTGCVNACQAWCGESAVVFSGCGCPTINSYGNSCDCLCQGDSYFYTGIPQIEFSEDLPCLWYDGLAGDCVYCPEP